MPSIGRVLVVGGGPAGMTAAIALARAGSSPEIVELDPNWAPEGVGLLIQTPPLRALGRIGLVEACQAVGFIHRVINHCDAQGNVVVAQPSAEPAPVAISRPAFHHLLQTGVRELGVPARTGLTVTSLVQDGARVDVAFSDGSQDAYDLVIGADGIHSRVRELVFGRDGLVPRYAGQIIWRVGLRRPQALDSFRMLQGPADKVGLVPISADELYLFMVQTRADPTRPPESELARRFRHELQRYGGFVPGLMEQIDGSLQVDFRALQHLLVPAPWYRGSVLLIGDAAHATTPHLAFGVGIAIEDSVVLGELVATGLPLPEVLSRFMDRRFERCRMVVEISLQLCRWEQHPSDAATDPTRVMQEAFGALSRPF